MQSLRFILYFILVIIFCVLTVQVSGETNENDIVRNKRAGFTYAYRYNNVGSCVAPGAPQNGYSYFQSTHVGAVVIHKCKPGFTLIGAKIRVCRATGKWYPGLPQCAASTCKHPGNLVNGIVLVTSTNVNSIVKYKCTNGYRLVGSTYQVCRANGQWTGTFPKCIGCNSLSDPANGKVQVTSTRIGAVATYSCNPGFNLVGKKNRVCRPNGEWSDSAPSCQQLGCGTLANPQNGQVTFSSTNVGATATYSCNPGFILVGVKIRTCQSNREWSGMAPVCRPISCGNLNSPENGKVIIAGTTPGSIATYSCNPGFSLDGAYSRTCQNNGKWSGTAPTCIPINCENLTPPDNGFITFSSSSATTQKPGDTATYSCSNGFRLVSGTRIRVCQQDGSYSGVAPSCQAITCGNLRDPPNGQVDVEGTFVGDTATYTCNRGFKLNGQKVRVCQISGMWSGQEPLCQPVDCGNLPNPQNGRVIITTTRLGGIAKYSCNDGFVLEGGNAVRRCLANGQWSGQAPLCIANNCAQLKDPANGHVKLTGTTVGSTATYFCNRGFQLVGQKVRICLRTVQWSGQQPFCRQITCESLQNPPNGQVTVTGTTPGSIARYTCNSGFRLVGAKSRVCQQDGTFTGTAPTCQPIQCEELDDPANGRVQVDGTRPGATATYLCNAGFNLIGQKTRVCQNDGSFAGQAPTCEPIFCQQLTDIENGQVIVSGNRPGSIATYSCNLGFKLVGQKSRVCQSDGTYTGQPPTCQSIDCGPLNNIPNGRVEFSTTTVSSVAKYFCNRGYNLVGNDQRICQQSGQWSGVEPKCNIVDCGTLSSPQNGDVDFTSTTFLSKASYSCRDGFRLVGIKTRTCQASGQWSGASPVCQPIDCEELENPENGIVVVRGNTVGAVATYSCNPGFELVGDEERTCQSNGRYDGIAPTCQVRDCGPLQNPQNGFVEFTSTVIRSRATYTCNKGFLLVGVRVRICRPDGEWSGEEPTCEIIRCKELRPPINGDVIFSSNEFGAVATYSCNEGFRLVGVKTRTCQIDSQWSGTAPFCQHIECGTLDSPANGIVQVSGTIVGSTATYSCSPGFDLIGEDTRICGRNGEWSGIEPVCKSIDCGPLQDPEYGKVTITGTTVNSLATYECNKGFKVIGPVTRVCLITGEWSRNAPTCQPEDCGELDDPLNGNVEASGTSFWDTATYTCDSGFELVGKPIRTCQENGRWSGVAPFCRSANCGFLDSPANGRVTFTGVLFNSVATYSCFPGFDIVGSTTRTCQRDGQWSGEEPFCKPVNCGPLTDPDNGKVSLTGTEVFSVASYTCNTGFGILGVSSRICQNNGIWSDSAPTCEPSDCGQLESPANGMVKTSGTKYWDTATYSCMTGYRLIGEDSRTCLDTGIWSNEAPICVAIDCGYLDSPQYGSVEFRTTTFRSRASYSCSNGFQLVGDRTRMCEANGQWSGQAPICQSVTCDDIVAPENGQLQLSQGNLAGSVASYTCNPGFQLRGMNERTCQSNGQWTGFAPSCIAVDCGDLSDILYGQVTLTGTVVKSIATYTCNSGFKLLGKSTRECLSNGFWSGIEPTCRPGGCGSLTPPANGDVIVSGTDVGDTATYSCNGGYKLIGDSSRTCRPNGRWSGQEPTCQAVDCGPLSPPSNGDIRVSNTLFGSSARYSCFPGYKLAGLSFRVCQLDGTWSGNAPICEISQCPVLPNPPNGRVTITGRALGSTATYNCNRGFELSGDSTRTCGNDQNWSGEEPICRAIDCSPLDAPDNGRVEFTSSNVGSVARFSCNEGFKIDGSRTRICQPNGLWSGQQPVCNREIVTCSTLPNPENGQVLLSGTNVGDTATYSCLVGFNIVGVDVRYCRSDGTWTGNEPRCRPMNCDRLIPPANGEIRYIGSGFGSIARYSCFPGYELVGSVSRTCKSDGFWSGQAPVCVPDSSSTPPPAPPSCGDPGTPANGIKIGSSYTVGSIVFYECNSGFKLVGSKSRLCRFDGQWSDSLPSCVGSGECVGSGKVEDDCGQECMCQNGQVTNCCRLRRDFGSLSNPEKLRYINAVTTASEDPVYSVKYVELLEKYRSSFDTAAQSTLPETSQFFVWNRFFLLEFEDLLREIDCRITIPYYDWTTLHTNPYIHPVWDDENGFGKSSRQSDNCVSSGPFNYEKFSLIESAGGECLKREYNNRRFPSRALIERDVLTRPASEFYQFQRSLQLYIHTNVRCFIGGTMCTKDAANDPVFILHLSMIDSIFTRWQGFDEERFNIRYSDDSSSLVLADQFIVSQFHDNSNLPNGVAVCYDEPSVKTHVPTGLYFLAQSLSDESIDNNKITCISEADFTRSGQQFSAADDMNFIKNKCQF